ncbi:MAG: hypothetical protein ABWZ53_11995 [Actinomycetota bacterium]
MNPPHDAIVGRDPSGRPVVRYQLDGPDGVRVAALVAGGGSG